MGAYQLLGLTNFSEIHVHWVEGSDANTCYFHACVKQRSKMNNLVVILVGDKWLESVPEVRGEISKFLKSTFLISWIIGLP